MANQKPPVERQCVVCQRWSHTKEPEPDGEPRCWEHSKHNQKAKVFNLVPGAQFVPGKQEVEYEEFVELVDNADLTKATERSKLRKLALRMLVRGADPKRCTAFAQILRAEAEDPIEGEGLHGNTTIEFVEPHSSDLTEKELGVPQDEVVQ